MAPLPLACAETQACANCLVAFCLYLVLENERKLSLGGIHIGDAQFYDNKFYKFGLRLRLLVNAF